MTYSYRRITTAAGIYSVVATCAVLPISTSLTSIFSGLTLLFWLLSGKFTALPGQMRANPVVLFASLLFLLFVVGLSYSPVPLQEGVRTLAKYRELLFIPVVMALLAGDTKGQMLAKNGFLTGCIVLMLSSYLIYFGLIPPQKYGFSFVHHITHSFFMALLCFQTVHRAIDDSRFRYLWLAILMATLVNLIFINHGRAGMVLFILLTLLTIVQRCTPKTAIACFLVFTGLLTGIYCASENVQKRTERAIWEVKNYAPEKSRTSLGMRFDWWRNSVELIRQKPVLGHGTGSFQAVQKEIKKEKTRSSDNPHNEYLFIGVQVGLVGVALYLLLFASQLVGSRHLSPDRRFLVQGVVLAMSAGCLANSFLFDSHPGHFYAFISALCFAQTDPPAITVSP